MAFTRAPMEATSKTQQVPLVYEWENRDTSNTKSAISANVLYEVIGRESSDGYYRVIKRNGSVDLISVSGGGNILGIFYWGNNNPVGSNIIVVTQNSIRTYDANTLALNTTVAFAGFIGRVQFAKYKFDSGIENIIISDGFTFGLYDGVTWTQCTDPDRPTIFVNCPVVLDGYLFLSDLFGHIYNSDLNNPNSWTASNFISFEAYSDKIVAMARVGTYIVALGTQSVEWFYDAANPTGTPLAPVQGATQRIGYIQGLASDLNSLYFVGVGSNGTPSVFVISDLKIKDIGNATIRRWLNNSTTQQNWFGHLITLNGHKCYMITGNDQETSPQSFYYDLETGSWHQLFLGSATSGPKFQSSTQVTTFDPSSPTVISTTCFVSTDALTTVRAFKPTVYQDSGVNFTSSFTTRSIDFGTNRMKFMSRMVFSTDQTSSSSTMSVSWSDNDQQSYTTARTIDLSNTYEQLYACGSFRKRSIRVTYADNFPMRWNMLEVDYEQGQT